MNFLLLKYRVEAAPYRRRYIRNNALNSKHQTLICNVVVNKSILKDVYALRKLLMNFLLLKHRVKAAPLYKK